MTGNQYKFSGKELDQEGGLDWYYFGARYYDPAIGRWGSVDPLTSKYPSWSPYTYALNNPINFIDPDGMQVDGDSTDLATFAGQLNDWITNNGIENAFVSVSSTTDQDGNTTFQLNLVGTGWNDLANGDQSVTGLTIALPFGGADANVVATNALNHFGDVVRSETVIDLVYGATSSVGGSTKSGGINDNGIHVGLAPGANLGVAMHELVGHGHPYYNSGWENDVGNVFGSTSRSRFHDGDGKGSWYGEPWGQFGKGGGYAGDYSYQYWFFGPKIPSFQMPSKLPRIKR